MIWFASLQLFSVKIKQIEFPKVSIIIERLKKDKNGDIQNPTNEPLINRRGKGKKARKERKKIPTLVSNRITDSKSYTDTEDDDDDNKSEAGTKKKERKSRKLPDELHMLRKYRFHCEKCPAGFYSKVELDRHLPVHNTKGRKPIDCIVCQRVFNRRDSLNQHLIAHQVAEERESLLLRCWPSEDKVFDKPHARRREVCKYCLLVSTSQTSYSEHLRTEHNDNGPNQFTCRYGKCFKRFDSIRELIEHSKLNHAKLFYGRLELFRMRKGVYTGIKSKDITGDCANDELGQVLPDTKNAKIRKSESKKRKRNRKRKTFTDSDDEEEERDSWPEMEFPESRNENPRKRNGTTKSNHYRINEHLVKVEEVDISETEIIEEGYIGTSTPPIIGQELDNGSIFSSVQKLDPFQIEIREWDMPDKIGIQNGHVDQRSSESLPVLVEIKRELI